MRKKRLIYNTAAALIFQLTALLCGFVLPRLILGQFGSEINGLVNSITQFLGIIAFMELGVGRVVEAALYKPLADQDTDSVSRIMVSAGKFFKRLALYLVIYVLILLVVYPHLSESAFGRMDTMLLILAMSISYFAQYYFGAANRLLLNASQLGYINYSAQTFTLVLNTVVCALLIHWGHSIHMVKLTTSLIFLLRPLVLKWYVDRHYRINYKITYTEEPIKQKWNGVAQHVAAIVLDSTANIILTLFSTLSNVSIYGVYYLVVHGVRQIFFYIVSGVQALLGELWAKQELEELKVFFGRFEWIVHTATVFVFTCTGVLIVPFVQVYTNGITDAEYTQPLFALVLTLAHALFCLRIPYNNMIMAAGHFKQTQNCSVAAAVLNLLLSVVMVLRYGLVGVAAGTLAAMAFQIIWMALYNERNLLHWPSGKVLKQLAADAVTVLLIVFLSCRFTMQSVSYLAWVILAVKVALIALLCIAVINVIFYRDHVQTMANGALKLLRRRK